MARSSIGGRLPQIGAATLLAFGLLVQGGGAGATAVAASKAALSAMTSTNLPAREIGREPLNVRSLIGQPSPKLPFDPDVAAAALSQLKVPGASSGASGGSANPAAVAPPPDLATDSGQPAASVPVSQAGMSYLHPDGGFPADPTIAVGPDIVLQSALMSFTFSTRAMTPIISFPYGGFFPLPEPTNGAPFITFDSDVRVHFDTLRQRWIASEVSWDCVADSTATFGHGFVDLGISDTNDPLGTWRFASIELDDAIPSAPSFGTSTDKLAMTASVFEMGPGGNATTPGCTSGAYDGQALLINDWAELGPGFNASKVHLRATILTANMLRVAIQEPVISPVLELVGSASDDAINYVDVTGSVAHNTIALAAFDLTGDGIVPAFVAPPAINQPGAGNVSHDLTGEPDSAIASNGTLAFASTTPCTPTGDTIVRDCVRVVTLDTSNPTVEPTRLGDTLLGSNGFDSSFPGIVSAGSGVLFAVYSQSSATEDLSSFVQYNRPGDDPAAWSAPQELTAGTGTYPVPTYGDYTMLAADPQDADAVWSGAQWANGDWATTINELSVGDVGAGYVPITPTRFLDTRFDNGLSGNFNAGVPRTFQIGGASRTPSGGPTVTIPANAVAITGNLTVTRQTAAGYVSLTPTPTTNPSSSTINFPLGDTRANNVTVALGPGGTLSAVYKAPSSKFTALILDVTGYFTAGAGQTYTPLAPTRYLDSRAGPNNRGQTTFTANVSKSVPIGGVTFDSVTVPSNAMAITANLTVVGQTKAGYVSLTPTPDNAPQTSTINFPIGDTRANGVTIPLDGVTGDVSAVYVGPAGAKADLILDVTGYYSTSGGAGLLFHPLSPGRRVDTRFMLGSSALGIDYGNGLSGAQGTTPRTVGITDHFGVPSGAAAITGNLTITGQTAAGYVSVTAASISNPSTSTINFPLGDTRANGITVPLGSGAVWFVYEHAAGKHVQLILDISGYFE